jgi:hypothetical protein
VYLSLSGLWTYTTRWDATVARGVRLEFRRVPTCTQQIWRMAQIGIGTNTPGTRLTGNTKKYVHSSGVAGFCGGDYVRPLASAERSSP